jgi:hypothetical protein
MIKYIFLIIFILFISCKTTDNSIEVLAPGNQEKINTENNDLAPTDQPDFTENDSASGRPFIREIKRNNEFIEVKSSSEISNENMNFDVMSPRWRDYLTGNVESISFLSKNSGVISFSHPLHPDFADAVNINITKQSGGTDLYAFQLDPEKGYEFLNLEPLKDINTEFWESHPFIIDTLINEENAKLLLWASDSHAPYSELIFKDGSMKIAGNIDIYYAFYINGEWSEKKSLNKINTDKNEITPFIYCLCQNPSYLFYSSNKSGDYDLLYNKINVDFEKQEIEIVSESKSLEKFNHKSPKDSAEKEINFDVDFVNTFYDERYPYIPTPYGDSLFLYYSSDMFGDTVAVNDTLKYINKGGFDIYKKELDLTEFECRPKPIEVKYEVVVLDAENPNRIVTEAFVELENAELINSSKNKFTYDLELNNKYFASGGSNYKFSGVDCKSETAGILSEYAEPEFIFDASDLDKKTEIFEEEVINPSNPDELESKKYKKREIINNIELDVFYTETTSYIKLNDSLYLKQITINKRFINTKSVKYNLNTYFTTDSDYNTISKSNKSINGGISTNNIKSSGTIRDTIWLSPVYQKPFDIKLRLYVINACDYSKVYDPNVIVFENGQAIDTINAKKKRYLDVNLKCGNNYEFYGGVASNSNYKKEAFPKRSNRQIIHPLEGRISNGYDIQSKLTETGGLIIDNISEDFKLSDTIFILDRESSKYTVDLFDGRYGERIYEPLIKIKNITENKELIIEKDRFTFYPNPEDKYEIYGGSNYGGNKCEEDLDYIILSYKKPIISNGIVTYFNDEEKYKNDINKLNNLDGINSLSLFGSKGRTRFLASDCTPERFNDTIYLIPEVYLKPPCTIEFTEFEGYNRNVPYFQTGFWEVNTSAKFESQLARLEEGFEITDNKIKRIRSDYKVLNSDEGLFPKIDDNYSYSIANARWIELHPNNKYWGWRYDLYKGESQERIDNRKKRIEEYKEFSKQVSENLDLMANKIKNNVLPIFKSIEENTPDKYGTKLLVEIIALSDKRDVERGWYIGDSNITYKSAKYDSYSNNLIRSNISINKPEINKEKKLVTSKTDLKKNNKTLSDLRAWFGYQEIAKRVLDDPFLAQTLRNKEILLPDNSNYSKDEIDNAKVIFAVSGQKTDEYSNSRINEYRRKGGSSYFTYDTTRRVEVVIRLVNYQNGKIYISDCCNEDLEFISSYKDANARKED